MDCVIRTGRCEMSTKFWLGTYFEAAIFETMGVSKILI